MRLLRRRRGAVALALALRGATRIQSNPLGAASSPTDVAHALVTVTEWVWIRVWSGPGWDEGDEGVEVGLGWDEGSCPARAGMRNVEAGLGRGEGGSERIREAWGEGGWS